MASFDPTLWRERAVRRFQQALDAGHPNAERDVARAAQAIEGLTTVVAWCTSRKLDVVFSKCPNGMYEGPKRTIQINGRALPELQLHLLLHECGHHLIGSRAQGQRFGRGYSAKETAEVGLTRTNHHRIDVLEEEFEAWERGRKLAHRLGVKLNDEAWHRTRATSVKTYMRWVLKVDGYGETDGDEKDRP